MNSKTIIGIIISLIWTTGWLISLCLTWQNLHMAPNEWGDFLSGACAPLALLWLVLGYYQQSDELKQNTQTLVKQEEELSRQVEALRGMAYQTMRSADELQSLSKILKRE